ncbi:MAG TPA: hypothetical protein VFU32_02185 [Ktedonobacterales bacterium]|nr:hypothetical protein [Ktedonobacterales bacterium]
MSVLLGAATIQGEAAWSQGERAPRAERRRPAGHRSRAGRLAQARTAPLAQR